MRRPSNRVFQVFQREREREKERDFHPQMAACFQVILTWSSLTTAKLFPLFSPPSLPPSFFRSGLLKDRERAQTKTMAGSYGAFRSKSGQVFKFSIDLLWKAARWRGEGFARLHPGGDVCLAVYATFPVVEIRNFAIHQMSKVSRLFCSYVDPLSFNVESLLSGEQVLPGNLPDVWIHCDSQTVPLSKRILSEIVYKNYSRTITISVFFLPFISRPLFSSKFFI